MKPNSWFLRRSALSLPTLLAGACALNLLANNNHGLDLGRYQVIVERNPFSLKPPQPPVVERPATSAAPSLDVKLTGITSLQARKRAFLMTAAPGEPAQYHALSEGQGDDRLKVLSIDAARGSVEALVDRVYQRLSFETHGFGTAFPSEGPQTLLEELRFDAEHIRAHEENERRELIRIEQERAEAEAELKQRAETEQQRVDESPAISDTQPTGS